MGFYKEKMIEEMKLRGLSERTKILYLAATNKFIQYVKRPITQLELNHVRNYKLHLIDKGLAYKSINQTTAALKFFLSSF